MADGLDLYYYTTVETMQYILKDANIYATNLRYMNDSEEYANGLKELFNIFNAKIAKSTITDEMLKSALADEITSYSISFSEARDLLSQWSMYAGESGVSIRMNFSGEEVFMGYPLKGKKRIPLTDGVTNPTVQKVYYCTEDVMDPKEYSNAAEEIWNKIMQDTSSVTQNDIEANCFDIWKKMTPYVKRAEFRAEEEHRLVFERSQWKTPFRIDYRNSNKVLKPYLDVKCEGGWPIHEIIIGPGFNQEVVFNSVLHFLNNAKLCVPKLSGKEYQERCLEYFKESEEAPDNVKKICEDNNKYLMDVSSRYKTFLDIRKKVIMLDKLGEDYKNWLSKREFTKEGIILSRSRIPYIYK